MHEDANNRAAGGVYEALAGLPLNEAGRLRHEAYSEDQTALLEFQCRRYIATYTMRTAHAILWITPEFAKDAQRVVAYNLNYQPVGGLLGGARKIYVDGRPAPPALAPHSFGGFSTGKWDGNMLNVEVSHLKAYYTQRPGVPASDQRTVSERWVRNGEILTMVMEVRDPAFLSEPLVWSMSWALSDGPPPPRENTLCQPSPELPSVSERRRVPFFLPGTNTVLEEVMASYGVPHEVAHATDGAAMMYPEYRKQMKQTASSLDTCKLHCDPAR